MSAVLNTPPADLAAPLDLVPRSVAGIADQSGRRQPAVASNTIQTVRPRNGKRLETSGKATLVVTFTPTSP